MVVDKATILKHQYEFAFSPPDKSAHNLLLGGFGSGKSRSIPLRWIYLIDWRARHQKIKCKMMIVEPTYNLIRDVLVPEMDDFFDSNAIAHRYHKSDHNYSIILNGIEFVAMLRSADNPASLTGKTVSDVVIDEFDKIKSINDQKAVWVELLARIRKAAHGTLCAVTTPEGFKYTYELWQEKNAGNPNFKLIRAKTRDNIFLPTDYIDNLVEQYDALLAKQYLEGEFVNLNNSRAYYMFNREQHTAPQAINRDLPIYVGMDFNVNPMTAVVMQREGILYRVISEYWLPNSNTRALAQLIASDWNEHPVYICPDMTGGARKTSADMSDIQILQSFGFQTLGTRNITERARLNLVNNLLDKQRITIDPKCKHLINDLEKVTTNEYGQVAKEKDSQLTHISDALGYACVVLDSTSRSKWGIQ